MILIKFLSILLLFFLIYPAKKLIKKEEFNFFDMLIAFHSLYFVIIPLSVGKLAFSEMIGEIDNKVVLFLFVFFVLLFFFLTLASIGISSKNKSILNTSMFFKTYPDIKINLPFKILLVIVPLLALKYYVPAISYISFLSEYNMANQDVNYEQSSLIILLGNCFYFSMYISFLLFFQGIKQHRKDIWIILSLLISVVNLMMLPRRLLVTFIFIAAILFYSILRQYITKKTVTSFAVVLFFIGVVYFPFYNTIRFAGSINFDPSAPLETIKTVYNYGVSNFDSKKQKQAQNSRSLGLYSAAYALAKYQQHPFYGKLTYLAFDHATPKIINPHKGLGTAPVLEQQTKKNIDISDSVLLLALGDFSLLGSLYTVLLFYLVFCILSVTIKLFNTFMGKSIIAVWCAMFLFRISFNIETKFDGILASIIGIIPIFFIAIVLHKLKFIQLTPPIDRK